MALGASRQVVRLILRQAAWMIAIGLVAGAGLALAAGRLLSGLLFEVTPSDPFSLLLTGVLLVSAGSAAVLLAARRAAAVDPVDALRHI